MANYSKEFMSLIITMVIGGLVYSITSFAYMHNTFTTKEIVINQDHRIDRMSSRIDKKLEGIDKKLDALLRARK